MTFPAVILTSESVKDDLTKALWIAFLLLLLIAVVSAIAEIVAKKTGELFIVAMITVICYPIILLVKLIAKKSQEKKAQGEPQKPPESQKKQDAKRKRPKDGKRPKKASKKRLIGPNRK